MSENCCQTTEDGHTVCVVPAAGQDKATGCATTQTQAEAAGLWPKVRGGLMFGLACITSPCCTPLIVPLLLGLLAGTPVAAWLTYYIGWVYGVLTLVSVISLIIGLRWVGQKPSAKRGWLSLRSAKKTNLPNVMEADPL